MKVNVTSITMSLQSAHTIRIFYAMTDLLHSLGKR